MQVMFCLKLQDSVRTRTVRRELSLFSPVPNNDTDFKSVQFFRTRLQHSKKTEIF